MSELIVVKNSLKQQCKFQEISNKILERLKKIPDIDRRIEGLKRMKDRLQEHRDALQLKFWRKNPPSAVVCEYLEANLPGWREETDL